MSGREIMFSLLSFFAVSIILSTKGGAHICCLLSIWKTEIGFEIHNWDSNIVHHKEAISINELN